MKSRIKLITFFHNEEFLVPFYLSHYWWADSIHAVFSKSDDRTEELLRADHRVHLDPFEFPGGKIDDGIKRDIINLVMSETSRQSTDWILVVDSDEFIWFGGCPECDAREILPEVSSSCNVLVARLWNVYRNRSDSDLDLKKTPVVYQRRHGDQNRDPHYQKPCVIRAGTGIRLEVGAHTIINMGGVRVSAVDCDGAHWQNADPCFCLARRVKGRSQRISDNNYRAGWGHGQYHLTEDMVMKVCRDHLDDPKCF